MKRREASVYFSGEQFLTIVPKPFPDACFGECEQLLFLTKNSAILLQGSAIFAEGQKIEVEDFKNRVIVTVNRGCNYEVISE